MNEEDSSAGGNHPFENYNSLSTSGTSARGFRVINGWALPGGAGSTKYVYFAFAAPINLSIDAIPLCPASDPPIFAFIFPNSTSRSS